MIKIAVTPRSLVRYLLGSAVTIILVHVMASTAQSLFVLAALERAGAEISLAVYLQTIWHDIFGLLWGGYVSYGYAIALGFAVALPVASLVQQFLGLPPWLVFSLAGAAVMAIILTVVQLNYFYHMSFFAGTRGVWGYLSQLAAGGLGGLVFAFILRKPQ